MKITGINSRKLQGLVAGTALLAFSSAGWAQLSEYSQDFEALNQMSPAALAGDGWLVFGNEFEPDGTTFIMGYGPFVAPNGGPGFSLISIGEGGVDQGAQQLVIYNDYNNPNHTNGSNNRIEANVFQEQTIVASDEGRTYVYSFDAKKGDIGSATTAKAFIRTLDPNAGFSTTQEVTFNTTSLPTDWGTYSLSITIGGGQAGQILQFGFASTASNEEPSGVFYDNVNFSVDASGEIGPFSEDFENLDQQSQTALGDAGWLVFANVFESNGVFAYNYGTFPAPNLTGAFSNVALNEGGPGQGDQVLVTFSDYNNGDHTNGSGRLIETSVFQERTITGDDVGEMYVLKFDTKQGDISGSSTAQAFIKTLDPSSDFFVTNNITVDTTALGTDWLPLQISITIDASLVGNILQFGFLTTASNEEDSGVFYDNVTFALPAAPDTDGDGITDDTDNCIEDVNPLQIDSNGDNIGNVCDADIAGLMGPGMDDCEVNFFDLGQMKNVFFSDNADADLTGLTGTPDGEVNFFDLGRMKERFFEPPGPSAMGCN